jgi:hypothetical protein
MGNFGRVVTDFGQALKRLAAWTILVPMCRWQLEIKVKGRMTSYDIRHGLKGSLKKKNFSEF